MIVGVLAYDMPMLPISETFEFSYEDIRLIYGRGCVGQLGEILDEKGFEQALVVTGSHVGANPDVMEPVTDGLRDHGVSVFDETTPQKRGQTVFDGINVLNSEEPDVIIGVGGGSSLDIARQMSVFAADGRPLPEYREAAKEGRLEPPNPDKSLTPVIVIPTTFAGADISTGGSIEILSSNESPTGQPVRTSGSIVPEAIFYDPNLFETTPIGALSGSAMNGFNKGIETLYARNATPITDATAVRGLQLLRDALPRLPEDPEVMERAIVGIILVQFERRTSIVHAFGHSFARRYDLQQGVAHAIVVPHVLDYLLEQTDLRREILAEGLGIEFEGMKKGELAEAIIDEVLAVRDALDVPTRLSELDSIQEIDLPEIAEEIYKSDRITKGPEGIEPTVDDIEAVLREAW